jgi:hypothetical protein
LHLIKREDGNADARFAGANPPKLARDKPSVRSNIRNPLLRPCHLPHPVCSCHRSSRTEHEIVVPKHRTSLLYTVEIQRLNFNLKLPFQTQKALGYTHSVDNCSGACDERGNISAGCRLSFIKETHSKEPQVLWDAPKGERRGWVCGGACLVVWAGADRCVCLWASSCTRQRMHPCSDFVSPSRLMLAGGMLL